MVIVIREKFEVQRRSDGYSPRESNSPTSFEVALVESASRVERRNYKAYEPVSGLCSNFRPLTFGNASLEKILLQIGRPSPINLRPLLGFKPLESTKGERWHFYLRNFGKATPRTVGIMKRQAVKGVK